MDYATTLAIVREYSELATLRPSPLRLRCVPYKEFVLVPVPAWRRRATRLAELAEAMAHYARPPA